MTALVWDETGTRTYETGVDHGVLYIPNQNGLYTNGVAWNGLVNVNETPSGAEANPQYADNIKYLNLFSAEDFGATIEAFTYPDEFAQYDGLAVPTPGVSVGQQARRMFGLSYRTRLGNDLEGDDYGYKLHLVYGCSASPSEKAYGTINDSPEAITFSWEITTTPVPVADLKPTALIVIDSTEVSASQLTAFETLLYGSIGVDPVLPLPDAVITAFTGGLTAVTPTKPTNAGNDITIPATAGVLYFANGVRVYAADNPHTITEDTLISTTPDTGYVFTQGVDTDWFFDHA